jgi:hypothetical protein
MAFTGKMPTDWHFEIPVSPYHPSWTSPKIAPAFTIRRAHGVHRQNANSLAFLRSLFHYTVHPGHKNSGKAAVLFPLILHLPCCYTGCLPAV